MARDALCFQCNMKFTSAALLTEHEKSGHQLPGEPITKDIIPPGVPLATPEMLAVVERQRKRELEQAKQVAQSTPPPSVNTLPDGTVVTTPEPPKPEPIKLTYLYIGQHDKCMGQVKTLEVDVKDSHVVLAYCQNCNIQIESREEKKL